MPATSAHVGAGDAVGASVEAGVVEHDTCVSGPPNSTARSIARAVQLIAFVLEL
jgi:hypothetical protein